ncbi:hypothetical protein EJB05_34701, partial [Eragrostis curvula]
MALLILLCFASVLSSSFSSPLPINATHAAVQDPVHVVQDVARTVNMSLGRRMLGSCVTGNPVDDCWRCDPNWADHRQHLADCAIGFGRGAIGGKNGKVYVVYRRRRRPDEPAAGHPPPRRRPGGAPVDHVRARHDHPAEAGPARGAVQDHRRPRRRRRRRRRRRVLLVQGSSHVIIHGVTIRGCRSARSDGDGVTVRRSSDVWVDHCTLEDCADGLIDVTEGPHA